MKKQFPYSHLPFGFSLILFLLVVVAGLFAQDPAAELFMEAEARFRKGDYLFALRRYEELIRDYPVSEYTADSWFRRGVILYRTGKSAEALGVLDRVEKRYGSTRFYPFIPFWKGLAHYSLEEYGRAEEELRRFLAAEPEQLPGEAEQYLALSLQKLGLTGEAGKIALSSLKRSGGEPDPWMLNFTVSLLLEAGEEEQALSLMEGIDPGEFRKPWSLQLAFYKAESLYQQGREDDAFPWYELALEAPLETASLAYQRLYTIYRSLGMEEKRDALFDRAQLALAEKPELLNRFLLQAGIEQFQSGSADLAASYFRRVARSSTVPDSRDLALLYLARHAHAEEETEEAVRLLAEEASGTSGVSEEILFTLAAFYLSREQWDDAAAGLERFLGSYPGTERRAEAEYLRAYAEYRRGNLSRALALVENIFSAGYTGSNTPDLLRLKSRIHIGLQQYGDGIATLKEYLPLRREDLEAEKDLLRLYYLTGDYPRIAKHAPALLERIEESAGQISSVDVRYLFALSLVAEKSYEEALNQFDLILAGDPEETILSYTLFYSGWSAYRIGRFQLAVDRFSALETGFPDHELSRRSLYLQGWSLFSLGSYDEAAAAFGRYGQQVSGRDADKGIFMYARSLAAAGNVEYATAAYQSLIGQERSAYADDALYAYAQLLQGEEKHEEAASAYYQLWEGYKTGPFAEEALYNRGELFYLQGDYTRAGDAFYFYRTRYPSGKLVDASLHYGARAALAQDEPFRAILLWEKLLEDYPESSYQVDALQGLAMQYQKAREYRTALGYYSRLLALYPERAGEIDAQKEVSALGKILAGADPAEARLQVLVEEEGTASRQGIDAMMELARIYLNKYDRQEEAAVQLLKQVADASDRFGDSGARAFSLLGDLALSDENYPEAVRLYLEAAAAGEEGDLAARALFRAAETALLAGDRNSAMEIVRKIETAYPGSEWAARGRELMEVRR